MKHKDTAYSHDADPSVAQQAAQWLVASKDPSASRGDKEALVAWLQRSPVHVEEFLRVSSLDAALFGRDLGFDADALVADYAGSASVRDFRSPLPLQGERARVRGRSLPRFALAASLTVIIASAATVAWLTTHPSSTYATDRGEQRSVSLPDGSLMELNTDTRVQVVYSDARRSIVLTRGEALFTVAKNPNRPFVVEAGGQNIRATGTRFSVSERSARTVVTVVEGSVTVEGLSPANLTAGQQLITAPAVSPKLHTVDPERATAWQEWKLYFDDVSLSEAVDEFNRYNQQQLRIADPVLAQRRISGVFFANQPDSLIAFMVNRDAVEVTEGRGNTRIVRLK